MGRVIWASAAKKKTTWKRWSMPPGWLHAPTFAMLPSLSASPLTGPGRKPTNLTRNLRFPAHQDGEGEQRGFVGEQEQIWPPMGPPELLKARAAQAAEPPAPVSPSHGPLRSPKGWQRWGLSKTRSTVLPDPDPRVPLRPCQLHTKPPGPERGAEGRGKSLVFPSSKDECFVGPFFFFLFIYFLKKCPFPFFFFFYYLQK